MLKRVGLLITLSVGCLIAQLSGQPAGSGNTGLSAALQAPTQGGPTELLPINPLKPVTHDAETGTTAVSIPVPTPAEPQPAAVPQQPQVPSQPASTSSPSIAPVVVGNATPDASVAASAPAESVPTPPVQRKIAEITFHHKGPAIATDAALLSHVEFRVGDMFTQSALDRSIKALFATGYFEDVYATPNELSPGHISVSFELTEKLKIRTISFEGNRHANAKKLRDMIKPKTPEDVKKDTGVIVDSLQTPAGEPNKALYGIEPNKMLGSNDLADAVRRIKGYYEKENYPDAKVITRTTPLENVGLVDITFVVDEGHKQIIKAIDFTGNFHIKAKVLRDVMVTKKESIWSFFTGSGKIQEENNDDDLTKIGELYRNKGYLEVKVSGPEISPHGNGVKLTYAIVEGPKYLIGNQTIVGNTLFTAEAIQKKFVLKKGRPLSPDAMEQTIKNIQDLYGSKGYIEVAVRTDMIPTSAAAVLDVKYTITEGHSFTVGSINIRGNTTTKDVVIARELLLAPGDVFSSTKMRTSEARLQNTGYFDSGHDSKVKLTPETPGNPIGDNTKDLDVAVTEGKTGNVSVGAGYGTLDGPTIFTELSQSNFDPFNPKNGFRGGGDKVRLFLSVGSLSNDAILNFEDPWLFQHRLAWGWSLYSDKSDYISTEYDERRTGFETYLRKRLFELVDGRLGYRFEAVDLTDMTDSASSQVQEWKGTREVSKVTLNFTRDTRDKTLFATSGSRYELDTALASDALGGGTDYWLVEGRGAQYYHSFEWPMPQYLTILERVGTMDSYGHTGAVPLFDRFFLGGPNTLRGFGFRKVSPSDFNGEPLGGKSYAFGSFEYAFQIAEPFQIATFYDVGFVNTGTADFSTASYNDDWGVGFRLLIMGAPLRLDYGIPITSASYNGGHGHFWFSFGTRF
jgi:outer membrane protein insertion porin family